MSVCRTVSEIFSVKKWRDLETWGRGCSRSLKMAPFDRSYDFLLVGHCKYRPKAVYCTIFKYLTLNNRDLEKVTTGSFKLVPFESLGAVSYSPSMAVSCIICEIKRDIGQKSGRIQGGSLGSDEPPPQGSKEFLCSHYITFRER